ncbi:MAG TPA: TonB-dependent receptor, partial [Prevotella sp.]|nr:TonB-dependent receptor [Prevotella sp.]
MKSRHTLVYGLALMVPSMAMAQTSADSKKEQPDTIADQNLQEVRVVSRKAGVSRMAGAINGSIINKDELFKAACCNLGESFTTNPSVDVNYSDAATGAKQIKLLGLSGTYVQMMTENLPNFRGAAAPFSLGYVPGPWMQSIQVSKGAASVKNGYEGITGQINVEYLKADDVPGVVANIYGDTDGKFEANATGNIHLNNKLTTELLTHYENRWGANDMNMDGFKDMPNILQYNLQNRWIYKSDHYMLRAGLSLISEHRIGGQTLKELDDDMRKNLEGKELYGIDVKTNRYEAYMKHAFILNKEHGTNIALMATGSMHQEDALYGHKTYYVNEKNVYASLMFEHNFNKRHNLSTGLSLNHDYFGQLYRLTNEAGAAKTRDNEKETVPGVYAQYTYNLNDRLIVMAGIRADHSSEYGNFVTPRFHMKWQANDIIGFRLSAGKGYRSVHALAENNNLLASSRKLVITDGLKQEEAWNYGISSQMNIPLFGQTLKLNAEYYYTNFENQAVIDFDSDVHEVRISNLDGKSYSHVFQVDATYPIFKGMTLTAAYRRNYVKETY